MKDIDLADLRAKAEAARAELAKLPDNDPEQWPSVGDLGPSAEQYKTMRYLAEVSPAVVLSLLDRLAAAKAFDPERYSSAIQNLLSAAWDAGAATALGECLSDGIEFDDHEVRDIYAKNPHRQKYERTWP